MTEITTPITAAAEQARALLASAAKPGNFRTEHDWGDGWGESVSFRVLRDSRAVTAGYEAQAATAHAMLAVAGELAGLRADVREGADLNCTLAEVVTALQDLTQVVVQAGADAADRGDGLVLTLDSALYNIESAVSNAAAETADLTSELVEHRVEGYARPYGWLARWRARRRARTEFAAMVDAAGAANRLHDTLIRAAQMLDCEGWDAWDVGRPDMVRAVERAAWEWPRSAGREQLRTQAWDAIADHLGQPLSDWQRESGRTRAEVVAMLRQVAATVTGSDQDSARPQPGCAAALAHTPAPVGTTPAVLVPTIPAGQRALEELAHLQEVLRDLAVTLPDDPNISGLRQGLAIKVCDAWEATTWVLATVGEAHVGTGAQGPVQDAVLLLQAALEEMGPAGIPPNAVVQAVRDRLTELLKAVAAAAVARAEVDR
ncbi:hypothetical protein [Nonomuraea endophytica]|uniref:hypothetical protein n=1 Tax=Nonomuraea endophytica TaxID=714136 RepID=UPI0037C8F830